jgi:sigma-54-specific transcriptional regulator
MKPHFCKANEYIIMDTFLDSNFGSDQREQTSTLLAFDELQSRSLSLSVRASALVFEDPVSRRLLEQIERIAPSDATVLIIGETGTGKELVARHIHNLSNRSKNIFGALNCAALSESLIESELFGHEKGSFTGAFTSKDGWFETANKGSLFLDEVGDLPQGMQAKLLRVLQEREVVKVGSRQPVPVDVRIIAATNVNLEQAVAASHFRADLYYRFNVATIQLSPLRERPRDILPLAKHFLKIYGERLGYNEIKLSPAAELTLLNYDWPGNIRELENAIHRALLVCPGNSLRPEDFKLSGVRILEQSQSVSMTSLESALQRLCEQAPPKLFEIVEETVIRTAFEFCEENQVQTARLLNISRNVLRHKLGLYGMLPNAQKKPSVAYITAEV